MRQKADCKKRKGNVQICSGVLISGRISPGEEQTARRLVGRLALRETPSPLMALGLPAQKGCRESCSPVWKFQLFKALYLFCFDRPRTLKSTKYPDPLSETFPWRWCFLAQISESQAEERPEAAKGAGAGEGETPGVTLGLGQDSKEGMEERAKPDWLETQIQGAHSAALSGRRREGSDHRGRKRCLSVLFCPGVSTQVYPWTTASVSTPLGPETSLLIKLITHFQNKVDEQW